MRESVSKLVLGGCAEKISVQVPTSGLNHEGVRDSLRYGRCQKPLFERLIAWQERDGKQSR